LLKATRVVEERTLTKKKSGKVIKEVRKETSYIIESDLLVIPKKMKRGLKKLRESIPSDIALAIPLIEEVLRFFRKINNL